jgi:hypothetical protein
MGARTNNAHLRPDQGLSSKNPEDGFSNSLLGEFGAATISRVPPILFAPRVPFAAAKNLAPLLAKIFAPLIFRIRVWLVLVCRSCKAEKDACRRL